MIVFVIRRYNDIDHLVPMIYKIAKDTNKNILVICQNPHYDIANDFRLQFLQDRYGVRTKYAFNAYTPSLVHRILAKLTCGSYHFKSENGFSVANFTQGLLSKFYYKYLDRYIFDNWIVNRYFDEKWAYAFLKREGATIIVFDFAKGRQYITNALFLAAKKLEIITIAVPPGAMMWDVRLRGLTSFESQEMPDYDFYMMQHEFRKRVSIGMGGPPEKMVTLGIPRYCEEWQEILYNITPAIISSEERDPGELRVLYIDRRAQHGMDELRLLETIKKVSALDFVRLLIKPHTRTNHLRVAELAGYARITPDISSVELIKWADVVIGTTSSILLEALIQKKTVLVLKYLCEFDLIIEEMKACWRIDSEDELLDALREINSGGRTKPYREEDVDALLQHLVYADEEGRDVLKGYKDFILAKEKLSRS
jgi:hypothetical protein